MKQNPSTRFTNFGIRALDITIALSAILLLLIPCLVIALMIWLDDRGPALFFQKRVGKGLTTFRIVKFRTMTQDKSRKTGDLDETEKDGLPKARNSFQTTSPGDPRITRMGKKIRSNHLDEFPQMINVLVGDMSVVGARPDTPVQEADYSPDYWNARHVWKPGITGPAQVSSGEGGMSERTKNELFWIENRSVSTYLITLIRTVKKVVIKSSF